MLYTEETIRNKYTRMEPQILYSYQNNENRESFENCYKKANMSKTSTKLNSNGQ